MAGSALAVARTRRERGGRAYFFWHILSHLGQLGYHPSQVASCLRAQLLPRQARGSHQADAESAGKKRMATKNTRSHEKERSQEEGGQPRCGLCLTPGQRGPLAGDWLMPAQATIEQGL